MRDPGQRGTRAAERSPGEAPRVAYIMSRFPLLTETFILREMLELERQGMSLEVFPLLRERAVIRHAEVQQLAARVHYTRFLSLAMLAANLSYFAGNPRRYLGLLGSVLKANWGSANLCLGALGIFPKTVYFARLVQEGGIGHVHAHYATHPALAAYIISALTGVSFSFTAHAHDIFLDTHMLAEKLEKARFVVAISQFNKAYLLRHAPSVSPDRIKVVHCGVDLASYDAPPEPERDTGEEAGRAIMAVCVASLQPYKGIKYLVRACTQVARRVPTFRCVVIGEGVDRPELEALIVHLDLQATVRLAGGMPQHEVAKLLRKADLFVLPSIVAPSGQMEGIPVALMEAMASRRPVIATRLSGIPELVEDGVNGLLVPPEDDTALADAITRLAGDAELRRRMGERGRETIVAEFELRGNVECLRALFETALRGGEATGDRLEDPSVPAGEHSRRPLVSSRPQD